MNFSRTASLPPGASSAVDGVFFPESGFTSGAGSRAEFVYSTEVRDPAWDRMLNEVSGAHFEQTSGWAAVKTRYGWRVLRLTAQQEGVCLGGVQVLLRRVGRFGVLGYVSRGPTTRPGYEALAGELVDRLGRRASEERWLYLVFDHAYHAGNLAQRMSRQGYHPHPEGIPPSGLLAATSLIDLTRTEEELWAALRSHTRRNIRRAQRCGLTLREGGAADLAHFRELMLANCRRRGSAPTPPQPDFFGHLWNELAPAGYVHLLQVCLGDEVLSAVVAFTIADTIRVWKVGWSGAHEDKYPNYFRVWEVLRWARRRGMREFDFVWVDTDDARAVARGAIPAEGFRDGSTAFKLGFGGRLVLLPEPQCRFYHPFLRAGYALGGRRLLQTRWFRILLRKYWAGANTGGATA